MKVVWNIFENESVKKNSCIQESQVQALFPSLDTLLEINENFLKEIEGVVMFWADKQEESWKVLLEFPDKCYDPYFAFCDNHEWAIELLGELNKRKDFQKLCWKQLKNVSIESLLITPI